MNDLLIIVISFIVSVWGVGRVRIYCRTHGLVDKAVGRSSHTGEVVRGGGILFVLLITPFTLAYLRTVQIANEGFIWVLFLAALFIAYLGWLDDKHSLKALYRLLGQMAAVAISLCFLPQIFSDIAPLWLEKTILFLAWVWFINLYNFLDGLDGYATCEATFIVFVLSFILVDIKPILLLIMGVSLGFLRLNFNNKQKLFMGDVGSTFLGFILGGILFYGLTITTEILWPLFTLPLLFTADATFTLIVRTLKGEKPWEPHRGHFYQRANQLGLSHRQVTMRAVGLNFALLLFIGLGILWNTPFLTLSLGLAMLASVALRIKYLEG